MMPLRRDLPTGTVTFLFTDVEGSTKLLHALGADAYAEVLAEHRRILRRAFSTHGGVEVDTQGDAFFVAFPTVPGALRAAVEALEGLGPGPIRVRMGIHTGTPNVVEEGYVGVDVHRAARIAACGHGGQVLISAATAALLGTNGLRDLGEHRLKDLSAAERIYQLGDMDFPALHSLNQTNGPAWNLPAPSTPLIGRHTELADLRTLFHGATRLVTLTGPGGTGKTRLALELAHVLAGEDAGGAWFVDLSSSTEVWQAISAIQGALGVTDAASDDPLEPLRGFLRPRRLLLLLDNLEQILGIAAPIAELLAAAPGLRVVATSRAPLRIGGEREYPLAPLPSGTAGEAIDVDAPPDAVALFVARARIGVPGFTLTSATADTVAELCRRLDGLPLAIELAASRVRLLSPAAILERLAAGLDILRAERRDLPARQRTLEAAIDWSYRLLDESAQRAFRHCATFAGGFTLPAFEAVCVEPDDDSLEVLGELVEHSLVERRQADEVDEPRFGMLETIRQFAGQRLDDTPESDAVRERHMHFFLWLAEAATSAFGGPEERARMPILRDSHDNLRAALEWLARVDRRDELVELVAVLSGFWLRDSHYLEGRRWIARALALEGAGSPRARATALRNLSAIADGLGDARAALGFASESVRLWETVGDVHGLADALRVESMVLNDLGDLDGARHAASLALGHAQAIGDDRTIRGARHELAYLAVQTNDLGSAVALLEENAEAMRLADDRQGLAATLSNLGSCQRMLGAHGPAEGSARQAIAILRTTGDDASLGSVLTTLGAILVDVGRLDEARAALVEGLAIAWKAGALHELPETLDVLGDLWRRNGDAFRAVELYAAASVLRDASGSSLSANDLDVALANARRDLASASDQQAWRSGSTTPLGRLVEDELRRRPVPDAGNRRSGAGS